ncbi:MAG TPA: substrate-binding domain-containing protein [Geodermatophilus sp.]|nr:substrate-binding domain-containing protein [Geodermatophilus sp.]
MIATAWLGVGSADMARRAAAELLAGPNAPTAFFTAQNDITVGVLQHLHDLDDGRDIGLVGFDDFPPADLLGITVIAQDVAEIGRTAASLLFDRIDGDRSPARRRTLPVQFLDRGSASGTRGLSRPSGSRPATGS